MKLARHRKNTLLYFLSIFVVSLFFCGYVAASVTRYPSNGWQISAPEEQGMHSKAILEMMEEIKEKGYGIQSISIVRNGYLVFDAQLHSFKKGQKHRGYSVTKSIVSALIGIAINKGYIKGVNQRITELFPNRKISNLDERKRSMTLKDLLTMTSGLDCKDGSANKWKSTFEMIKSNDWTQYTLNMPMAQTPGEHFHYCNGVSHVLSAIIHESTGMKTIDFGRKYLFEPLGIKDIRWETSPEGIENGYAGLWLQPKDMAKIGWLYLNRGKWEDKRILSAKWIEASIRPYIDGNWAGEDYGYQWWVNPAGFYSAVGMYGQAIHVVPGKELVAVFTANIDDRNMYISTTLLQEYVIPSVASSEPLPPDPDTKARLDEVMAGFAKAPTQRMIWSTEKEGVAEDGIFKRTAPPSFQFNYPPGSMKTKTLISDQIMRMKTVTGDIITASIYRIPRDWRRFFLPMKLEDFGPKVYASWMKKFGSNIRVLSNNGIMLKCGTQAYRTVIEWTLSNSASVRTNLLSAYKGGKSIYIAIHQFQRNETVEPIIQSWAFD